MKIGDIVICRDERRKVRGKMEVVKLLSNDQVRVRGALRPGERRIHSRSAKHWIENISELEVI